jgi:hypothetical protein
MTIPSWPEHSHLTLLESILSSLYLQITSRIISRPTRLHAIHDSICNRAERTFLLHASGPEQHCHHISPALARSVAQSFASPFAELHKAQTSLQKAQLPCGSTEPHRLSVSCVALREHLCSSTCWLEVTDESRSFGLQHHHHRPIDCASRKVGLRLKGYDQACMGKINMTSFDQRQRSRTWAFGDRGCG